MKIQSIGRIPYVIVGGILTVLSIWVIILTGYIFAIGITLIGICCILEGLFGKR